MTRSELIKQVYNSLPKITQIDADMAVRVLLEEMVDVLSRGERIEIRGFGSFKVSYRAPRTGHNPKTGEKIDVPAKYVPRFRASKVLQKRVSDKTLNRQKSE